MSKYSASDLPMLRSLRNAYRVLLDAANRQKAEENDVGMLLAYCCVVDELQAHFERVGRALTVIERKGHGCPAPSPAVGPAPAGSTGGDITHSANRFLFTPPVQKLPVLSAAQASKSRSRA